MIGPENSHLSLSQSEFKLKPIEPGSREFSRVSRSLAQFYQRFWYLKIRWIKFFFKFLYLSKTLFDRYWTLLSSKTARTTNSTTMRKIEPAKNIQNVRKILLQRLGLGFNEMVLKVSMNGRG